LDRVKDFYCWEEDGDLMKETVTNVVFGFFKTDIKILWFVDADQVNEFLHKFLPIYLNIVKGDVDLINSVV